MKTKLTLLVAFLVTHFFTAVLAAEVVIPDAALKSAIWQTLGRPEPVGILTEQDMLSVTNLNACCRGVRSLDGLGAGHNLTTLDLSYNQLTTLTLPADLMSLTTLDLRWNRLTSLTLPDGLTNLTELYLFGNPLQSFVIPEPVAIGALAGTVADLLSQGVSVTVYLPGLILTAIAPTDSGNFEFLLTGPPGTYRLQVTLDFSTWTDLDPVTLDVNGSVKVTDPSANARPHSFYRAVRSN